jgi:hypothetical protein
MLYALCALALPSLLHPTNTAGGAEIDGFLNLQLRVLLAVNNFYIAHDFIIAEHFWADLYTAIALDTFTQVNLRNSRHNFFSYNNRISVLYREYSLL